jgi:hypothetical protein
LVLAIYHSNNIKYYCIEIQKARKRAFCLAENPKNDKYFVRS